MAEVLGVVSGIIAVLQLTATATECCYRYISIVKNAPKEIQAISTELSALNQLLLSIQTEAEEAEKASKLSNGSRNQLGAITAVGKILPEYKRDIEALLALLNGKISSRTRRVATRIIWAIKAEDVDNMMKQLHRYKDLFHLALTTDVSKMTRIIEVCVRDTSSSVSAILAIVQEEHSFQRQREARELYDRLAIKRAKVFKWLYPYEMDSTHADVRRRQHPGTGTWLFRHPEFTSWKMGKGCQTLWGPGIPGAGKTVLSSIVIDHIKQHISTLRDCSLGYIYFNYQEQLQQTPERVIRSLIQQIWTRSPLHLDAIPDPLEKLYDRFNERSDKPSLADLENTLALIKDALATVYFVFDALDECDEKTQRNDFLRLFASLGSGSGRIFITSRPHLRDIVHAAREWTPIRVEAKEEDVRLFVNDTILARNGVERMINDELRAEVVSILAEHSKGMFLLVQLYVEYLCQQTTENQVRRAMTELKATIKTGSENALLNCYDRALFAVRKQSPSRLALAWKVLGWLMKSLTVLTISELRILVSIDADTSQIAETDMPDGGIIIEICAGLVIVERLSEKVQFAHYTIAEYLQQAAISELLPAPEMVLYTSIKVMTLDYDFGHDIMSHATTNLDHYADECDQNRSKEQMLTFFHSKKAQARIDNVFYNGDLTPLALACLWRHTPCLEQLLDDGHPMLIDTGLDSAAVPGGAYRELGPLHLASLPGNEAVLNLLILRDADITSAPPGIKVHYMLEWAFFWRPGYIALEIAQRQRPRDNSSTSTLSILGRRLLHLFTKGKYRMHLIHIIIRFPKYAWILRHILNQEAMLNQEAIFGPETTGDPTSEGRKSKLSQGSQFIYFDSVVTYLCPYIFNTPSLCDLSPRARNYQLSELLSAVQKLAIQPGALETKDYNGCTALHIAAFECQPRFVSSLLRQGANVHAIDDHGNTPLHAVSCLPIHPCHHTSHHITYRPTYEIELIMDMLLEAGADVNQRNSDGWTPLHQAVCRGGPLSIALLVSKGADVLRKTNDGETPLMIMRRERSPETDLCDSDSDVIEKMLLSEEAKVKEGHVED